MRLIRWLAQKILPSKLYLFVASKIYVRIWEMAWRLGLVEATLGDICRSERAIEYTWALRNIKVERGEFWMLAVKEPYSPSFWPVLALRFGA
jgi:hypothetical protein